LLSYSGSNIKADVLLSGGPVPRQAIDIIPELGDFVECVPEATGLVGAAGSVGLGVSWSRLFD
jgi:hypothetical protein